MPNEPQPIPEAQKRIRGLQQNTLQLPVLPSVDLHESPLARRRSHGTMVATTALALVGLFAAVGIPLLYSQRGIPTIGAAPPGSTDTLEPQLSPSPSGEPGKQQQQETVPPPQPTPSRVPSVCETQTGTYEAQLPDGEPVLPATTDRPSVFVISPDRSGHQSFSIRPANDSDADWNTIYEGSDVGIIGLTTTDIRFSTSDGRAVWAKSCEPGRAAAVTEVYSRMNDLCNRREFGLKSVVVYEVDATGKPKVVEGKTC